MKGILFKPDMIKAIVEDRKTQTRRVDKLANKIASTYDRTWVAFDKRDNWWLLKGRSEYSGCIESFVIKPRYQVGEAVYIKEACYLCLDDNLEYRGDVIYKDSPDAHLVLKGEWVSPLFIPAWAARYFIRITGVRAERLQEITEEDAMAEGCRLIARTIQPFELQPKPHFTAPERPFTHRDHFIGLWDSINKPPYDWDSNPWVWVYSFEALKGS